MKLFRYIAYHYHRLMPNSLTDEPFTEKYREYHTKKMKHYKGMLAIIAIILFLFSQPTIADEPTLEQIQINTVQQLLQSTIKITSNRTDHGSGFYIAPNRILTNWHVVAKGDIALTAYDGRECPVSVGYREEVADLAVLITSCEGESLTFSDTYEIGQTVIAVGNPDFFDFTVTKGIVSGTYKGFIQFDAAVNRGSSGGVLADTQGEVIGIVTSKALDMNKVGLAIPAKKIQQFLKRSKEGIHANSDNLINRY